MKPYQTYDQWVGRLASENKTFGDPQMEKAARGYQTYKLRHGGRNVVIDSEGKFKGYCLNLEHPHGGPKARVFKSVLGIGPDDAEYLEKQIRNGLLESKIVFNDNDQWGRKYETTIPVKGRNGNVADVTVGWIFDYKDSDMYNGDNSPRLASAYIKT